LADCPLLELKCKVFRKKLGPPRKEEDIKAPFGLEFTGGIAMSVTVPFRLI